jgi:hypothetical protein
VAQSEGVSSTVRVGRFEAADGSQTLLMVFRSHIELFDVPLLQRTGRAPFEVASLAGVDSGPVSPLLGPPSIASLPVRNMRVYKTKIFALVRRLSVAPQGSRKSGTYSSAPRSALAPSSPGLIASCTSSHRTVSSRQSTSPPPSIAARPTQPRSGSRKTMERGIRSSRPSCTNSSPPRSSTSSRPTA